MNTNEQMSYSSSKKNGVPQARVILRHSILVLHTGLRFIYNEWLDRF